MCRAGDRRGYMCGLAGEAMHVSAGPAGWEGVPHVSVGPGRECMTCAGLGREGVWLY